MGCRWGGGWGGGGMKATSSIATKIVALYKSSRSAFLLWLISIVGWAF